MIDEKKLIERLRGQHKGILANYECYSNAEEVADEICNVISIIDELPKVCEWIPVSERLPYDGEEVLVTVREDIFIAWNEEYCNQWHTDDCDFEECEIDAWMPLPEPYKEGD